MGQVALSSPWRGSWFLCCFWKSCLSNAIFKDKLDPMVLLEGLWGGYLPIISYWYKREAGGWIEYTAAPVADMQGSMEQDAYFRVQRIAENGTVLRSQYYENYAYTAGAFQDPEQVPASGGCYDLVDSACIARAHASQPSSRFRCTADSRFKSSAR